MASSGSPRVAGRAVVDGLDTDELDERPGPEANTIAWLIWHLARIEDDHVGDAAGIEQAWTPDGTPTGSGCRSTRGERLRTIPLR